MPTYGYRCTSCGTQFERFQKMSDPPVTTCEACGAPVKKILYPVGISFKGSGFYVNDYKGASAASKESAGDASSETKTETKPAETKTEAKPESGTITAPAPPPASTSESKPAA